MHTRDRTVIAAAGAGGAQGAAQAGSVNAAVASNAAANAQFQAAHAASGTNCDFTRVNGGVIVAPELEAARVRNRERDFARFKARATESMAVQASEQTRVRAGDRLTTGSRASARTTERVHVNEALLLQ
jgi:hypothetical protein